MYLREETHAGLFALIRPTSTWASLSRFLPTSSLRRRSLPRCFFILIFVLRIERVCIYINSLCLTATFLLSPWIEWCFCFWISDSPSPCMHLKCCQQAASITIQYNTFSCESPLLTSIYNCTWLCKLLVVYRIQLFSFALAECCFSFVEYAKNSHRNAVLNYSLDASIYT